MSYVFWLVLLYQQQSHDCQEEQNEEANFEQIHKILESSDSKLDNPDGCSCYQFVGITTLETKR